jgi:hypothetical protein
MIAASSPVAIQALEAGAVRRDKHGSGDGATLRRRGHHRTRAQHGRRPASGATSSGWARTRRPPAPSAPRGATMACRWEQLPDGEPRELTVQAERRGRSIPTRVGNTSPAATCTSVLTVHPHARIEPRRRRRGNSRSARPGRRSSGYEVGVTDQVASAQRIFGSPSRHVPYGPSTANGSSVAYSARLP